MTTFIALAAFLSVLGVALVCVPLLTRRGGSDAPASITALACTVLLVAGAALLYAQLSNWGWHAPPAAATGGGETPQAMVAKLARRLESNPNDLEGWLMLGRSYAVLQQYPLALRAYERADRLAGGRNVDALVGEAEVLTLTDERELDGRAGRLVEQALALNPASGKALFFGAAAAMHRGELPLARERFSRLLALDPPQNVRPLIEQQIRAIDERLAGGGGTKSGATPAGAADSRAAASAATPSSATASAPTDAVIRVEVRLGAAVSASPGIPMFVFVHRAGERGPPLAVKRLDSRFPQTVELTPQDAMVPGRSFSAGQDVQVTARIARSGNPVGAAGDSFGEIAYHVGRDGTRPLVIDQTLP